MTEPNNWKLFNDLEKLQKDIAEVHQGVVVLSVICGLILVFANYTFEVISDFMMMIIAFLFGTYIGIGMIDRQIDKIMESEYE